MSKRLLHKLGSGALSAKVYRDSEWDEYVVKLYNEHGMHMPKSDYFTTDEDDALATAHAMVTRGRNPMHARTR